MYWYHASMKYIVEEIKAQPSSAGSNPFSRTIIGEAQSVSEVNGLMSAASSCAQALFLMHAEAVKVNDKTLSQMLSTLMSIDRNGIVSPRLLNRGEGSYLSSKTPFDTRIISPNPACILVRESVFLKLGGFDENAATISDAIVSFGLAMNDLGYSSAVANNAWIVTDEAKDALALGGAQGKIETLSGRTCLEKQAYLDELIPFVASSAQRKPKILFDFHDMPPFHCGTSEYEIALLKYFKELYSDAYEVTVRCNKEAVVFHGIAQYSDRIILPDEEAGLFDLGLVAIQPIDLEKQIFLNAHCVRFVFTMLDCILLRTRYLVQDNPDVEDVARCGLRNCDGIIAISEFSRNDYLDYFASDVRIQEKPSKVVYIATDFGNSAVPDQLEGVPFDSFTLVVGNTYKHKALENVLDVVANTGENYVFVGLPQDLEVPDNVVSFPHATLSEEFLNALYAHSDCVVFPSQYEGFGLPITIAFKHGKKVIVCDNDLNREIQQHFSELADDFVFFSTFSEIPSLVRDCVLHPSFVGQFDDSWKNAIIQIEQFLSELLEKPVDWYRMDERQWVYRLLEEECKLTEERTQDKIGFKSLIWDRCVSGRPLRERIFRKLGWADQLEQATAPGKE